MAQRRVVYTALLGGYEDLIEQEVAVDSGVDFVCFTDDPELHSTTWEIRLVEPSFPLDLIRSQRELKIRGHSCLAVYDEILYIDNSVLLRLNPNEIFDIWLADADYAVSLHSRREKVIDEFDEVRALRYDDPARIDEQLLHYADLYPEVLEQRPYWNGMSARRNTPAVTRMMEIWFDHVLRYSRRDQLSANVAFALGGVRIREIDEDNNDSPSHQWPAGVNRRAQLTLATRRHSGPLLAEVRRLQREFGEFESRSLAREEKTQQEFAARLAVKDNELEEVRRSLAHAGTRSAAVALIFGHRFERVVSRLLRR